MSKNKTTKKTIFFLINSMEGGGAERVLSNILPSLSKDYNIYLLLLKDNLFYDLPNDIKIIAFSKIKHNFLMLPLFPFYVWKLKSLMNKHTPYKIISFLEIANFVNILSNKNAIISFRTSLSFFDNAGTLGNIYKFFIQKLYPRASRIIVNSKENKIILSKKLNIPTCQVLTIYNLINTADILTISKEDTILPFHRNHTTRVFITIGRLCEQKNINTIIKIFKHLPSSDILLILGDGPERNNLKELIKKHNLQKQVFLLGRQKNVYKYLNISDYFIFASSAEGFPNVLIEAMAFKLPIITSDFKTGAREIIDSSLSFDKGITYPCYGPNGVLLDLNIFQENFKKVNFSELVQHQGNFNQFNFDEIINQWQEVLK